LIGASFGSLAVGETKPQRIQTLLTVDGDDGPDDLASWRRCSDPKVDAIPLKTSVDSSATSLHRLKRWRAAIKVPDIHAERDEFHERTRPFSVDLMES
jgi:hypothetical protein